MVRLIFGLTHFEAAAKTFTLRHRYPHPSAANWDQRPHFTQITDSCHEQELSQNILLT